jgi:hypothetical protein
MSRRQRLFFVCLVPAFPLAFLVVSKLFGAWRDTLSLADLHLIVFDHSSQIAAALWVACFALACMLAWVAAGLIVRREDRARDR